MVNTVGIGCNFGKLERDPEDKLEVVAVCRDDVDRPRKAALCDDEALRYRQHCINQRCVLRYPNHRESGLNVGNLNPSFLGCHRAISHRHVSQHPQAIYAGFANSFLSTQLLGRHLLIDVAAATTLYGHLKPYKSDASK